MTPALVTLAALAAGAPHATAARVVHEPRIAWASASLVYIAPADSSDIASGDRIVFVSGGKTVATGTVAHVDPGGLATAAIGWGSLAGIKHLDRVSVLFERPVAYAPERLAIGCPAPTRAGVLWACGSGVMPALLPPVGYAVDSTDGNRCWLTRDATHPASAWPHTLVLRAFEDAADEEIALERGELDVALFWPGELSTHMREQPRWQGSPVGTRGRGALVAVAVAPAAPEMAGPRIPSRADSASLDYLNRFLFRGDLVSWGAPVATLGEAGRSGAGAAPAVPTTPGSMPTVEFVSDAGCSRTHPIEGFFGRSTSVRGTHPDLRMFYLDAAVRPADSLALGITGRLRASAAPAMRARADSLGGTLLAHGGAPLTPELLLVALRESVGVVRVSTLACPIVCAPELRSYLETIGADALADLIGRLPAAREP